MAPPVNGGASVLQLKHVTAQYGGGSAECQGLPSGTGRWAQWVMFTLVFCLKIIPISLPSPCSSNSHRIQNFLLLRIQCILLGSLEGCLSLSGVRVGWSGIWRKEALILEEKRLLSFVGFPLHFHILRAAKIMSFVTKSLVYIWCVCVYCEIHS